jgi:hypothetical protein|tara:strand:+ start:490 stop:636 length:147 start_codon:yes stop_codon:yes gene_type:complete
VNFQTLKQRASLKQQKKKEKAKRIWKPKKITIKYDNLLDGKVANKSVR